MMGQEEKHELRKNLRIKEDLPISWYLPNKDIKGEGRIKDLSTTGLCLETEIDLTQIIKENGILTFDKTLNGTNFPAGLIGRLIWQRKKAPQENKTLCGVEFVNPKEDTIAPIRDRIQNRIQKTTNRRKFLSFLLLVFSLLTLFFVSYVVKEYVGIYQKSNLSNQMMITTLEKQVALQREVNKQLAIVKDTLVQTELALANVKQENELLKQQAEKSAELEAALNDIKAKNDSMALEVSDLKNRLQKYEKEIKTLAEGHQMITMFRGKIHEVKMSMDNLKRDAFNTKIAAFKELDRLKMVYGNHGYVIRDGKLYKIDAYQKLQSNGRIEVNVEFIQ